MELCLLSLYVVDSLNAFADRGINGYSGANARRRITSDKQGPTVVHQKPGPLQTIFNLLPDELSLIKCISNQNYL